MTEAVTETTRFGITDVEWEEYCKRYQALFKEKPADRYSEDGLVFLDWEAEKLAKVFVAFKDDDPEVCAVIAHMMWYVTDRNHYTSSQR